MKFFADTRTKRTTAFAMLLVWPFALTSGVANACFLETPESHSRAAKGSTAMASHASAELLGHQSAPVGHDDDSNSTKELCLKVCDDGTNAVPKAYSGHDHTDPGSAHDPAPNHDGAAHGHDADHDGDDGRSSSADAGKAVRRMS